MDISQWIDIGQIAAERDDNLQQYFYDAGVSKAIVDNRKHYLLLGRKGAGKTAVFLHLKSKPSDIFNTDDEMVALSLNNYSWNSHKLLSDPTKATGFTFRDSWRFVVAIETIRAICQMYTRLNKDLPTQIKVAKDTIERIFSKPIPTWSELLAEKLFRLSKIKLPSLGTDAEKISADIGEVSFEDIQQDVSLKDALSKNMENLTNYLEKVIVTSEFNGRIFHIFDKLDEGWIPASVDLSREIISGLIHAANFINERFDGKVRPIIFLREDIFSSLEINDLNKLKEDCGSVLKWDHQEIEKLILKRLNYFASLKKQPPIQNLMELFDRKEMRSRTSPVRYIYNRTFCRPRDMVAFMKKIINEIEPLHISTTPRMKLSVDTIYSAESAYSEYLHNELIDEWKTQDPNFLNYLSCFENIGTSAFTLTEYENQLHKKNLAHDRSSFRSILRFLFDASIIGLKIGKSNRWQFKCFAPNQAFQDADIYRVHYGLKNRLGLKDSNATDDE